MFPADNPWNTDVSEAPVHSNSDNFIDSIGRDTHLHPDFGTEWESSPIGIPYTTVTSDQSKIDVSFDYDDESDPGPYPIPPDAPIEGGPDADGDRHVLVVDTDECMLYELFDAHPVDGGIVAQGGHLVVADDRVAGQHRAVRQRDVVEERPPEQLGVDVAAAVGRVRRDALDPQLNT